MHDTIAYYESVDQGAAYNALTGVADQIHRVVGDDIQIPAMNQIVAIAGGVESAAAHRARLVAPSLRRRANYQVTPLNTAAAGAVEPGSPQAVVDLRRNPLAMIRGEQLNFEALADPVAAQIQWGVVFLAAGPIEPVAGKIFTIRATGATALVAGTWTNVTLTFDEDLPAGEYDVVGLRPQSAGLIAARLVFIGGEARPGALGVDAQADIQDDMFRRGGLGVWGHFKDDEPPTVDCLAISADATQEFYFDLVQTVEQAA